MSAPIMDQAELIEPVALITKLVSGEMTPLADAADAQHTRDTASLLSTAFQHRCIH